MSGSKIVRAQHVETALPGMCTARLDSECGVVALPNSRRWVARLDSAKPHLVPNLMCNMHAAQIENHALYNGKLSGKQGRQTHLNREAQMTM